MPDDTSPESTTETPAEPTTTQTPPPQPAYVTMEQFTTMMTQMQESFQQGLHQMSQQFAGAVSRPAPAHDEPEPTDDEIDAAAVEGKGVGAAVKRATRAAMRRLERQTAQQVDDIRGVGLPAIGEIAIETAKQRWEHYDRYKKEIDGALAQLSPEQRAFPNLLNRVYDMVVGSHHKELVAEEREKTIREQRDTDSAPPRGTKNATADDPTPEKVFSSEDLGNLRLHGKDIDTIAKKLGKTREQYLEGIARYNARSQGKAA